MISISKLSSSREVLQGFYYRGDLEKCFYLFSTCRDKNELFDFFIDVLQNDFFISIVGCGPENNPHNKSEMIQKKIGFFGQNNLSEIAFKNFLNINFLYRGKTVFFSHYVGHIKKKETLSKFFQNGEMIFFELISKVKKENLIIKSDYIGVDSVESVRIL